MRDYADLEHLLFRGFLTTAVEIQGTPMVLKTWNHQEQTQAQLQGFSMAGEEEELRLYTAFTLAYSTLFFAHENVLANRQTLLREVAAAIYEWPVSIIKSLMVTAHRLNVRAAKAMEHVEAYSYGPTSRRKWRAYQNIALCDPRVTGMQGTEVLGMNEHQSLWSFFNVMEDEEEQYLRDWQIAKFVTSPHAPKDIKRIEDRDSKKLNAVQKRRQALHEGRSPLSVTEDAQIRITNESAEDLMAQMEATIRGEKDFHDYVIEQHQKRVRENYLRQQEEAARERERILEIRKRKAEDAVGAMEGYTPEEVAHFLAVTQAKRREELGSRTDDYQSMEERETRLVRWGFIEEGDVPARHREEPREYNPLIVENYKKVAADLNDRNPDFDPED